MGIIDNQILCGDHLPILATVPDNCIDMFLTSPPYDNLRSYHGYTFQFEPLAQELYRVLKPGGVGVWIVGDQTINGSESLTSFKQALYFKEEVGFNVHDTMIWDKKSFTFPSQDRYHQVFEYMLILTKGIPRTFHPLKDRRNKYLGKRGAAGRKRNGDRNIGQCEIKEKNGMRMNIWSFTVGKGNSTNDKNAFQHPALFPEKLAEDHILSWSNPGDLVLDPMCGSGTTCVMAVKHGRRYLGIDCSEQYCELARRRVALMEGQLSMFPDRPIPTQEGKSNDTLILW